MIIVHIQWCAFKSFYITKPDRGAPVNQHMWLYGLNQKPAWCCKDKEQHCCQILLWGTSCVRHRNTMSWSTEWPCGHVDRLKTTGSIRDWPARTRSSQRRSKTQKKINKFWKNQQALKKKGYVSSLKEQYQENVRLAEAARGQAWGLPTLRDIVWASGWGPSQLGGSRVKSSRNLNLCSWATLLTDLSTWTGFYRAAQLNWNIATITALYLL